LSNESEPKHPEAQKDLFGWLLRLAGSRPAVPDEVADRVKFAVHSEWKRTVRKRVYRKRIFAFTLTAAACFVIYFLSLRFVTSQIQQPGPLGFVENITGRVLLRQNTQTAERVQQIARGDILTAGSVIQTSDSGRLLLHLTTGSTIRLDTRTNLRMESQSSFRLDHGAVYFDSGKSLARVSLVTPVGIVTDIGTQFEVRLADQNMRIRVREGFVSLNQNGVSRAAHAGTELTVDSKKASVRTISPYGAQWDWVSQVAPTFRLEGHSLQQFLGWVTRENGWTLQFAEPRIAASANRILLHGSIQGLSPELTPGAVLPICGLGYDLQDGVLIVKPGNKS